jgi:leucyl-tRNA synthetase
MYQYKESPGRSPGLLKAAAENLTLILSPFTPHICEELWQMTGHGDSLYGHEWPSFDERALILDMVEIVIQINGKVKEKILVRNGLDRDGLTEAALADPKVAGLLDGKEVVKLVAVPGKLLNAVVK